ncbi:filamentous hemagglutinin [Pseudomonas savastanoi pv. retacarpa]|uniref:two-partner secretion domain-containing protein n=1 Tax=Pseudomonas savastanoi TaxID=29438 RepID=UPI0006E53D44|nr:filamentous hemagglutinin N-terminal domain-containing protein [Pseudomonas savastanoi]KPY45910.1 peptidase M23 [Pseudomonas savastanoi pv. retacarpa]OSR27486.1 filamentous hemagglutinin [Pseudomonas savastanoi pv. retacarpa]RML14563.1 Filamentous hemagglutinin [Pseudomonas savastanoi pv. retacarpa]RMP47058.1 Filamentous hemagglutinin [Pseudomonas savastanoi pv. retacarpa]
MDAHQLALLARQPSAAVAERTRFLGIPKRLLALLLANVMFWQPIWAQADGIAVSGTTNTSVGQAGNGVPVINIAAPNAAGLSHNQYQQYNVDSKGVILNNATNAIQATQLGGNILGNSQLGGRAASTILNEVTGANASQLNGYTEVAGQAARVIIANPYGVTCSGCGFINTPRVTLSTGKPVLDANGKLDHFAVDGGSVTIDGKGLDASAVDQFDLITRSAKINADIYAKQLNIVTGANDVNADTLATTQRAANAADKPQLAIDSSALGGMYANAIKLVGTEQGVGVKTAGNMAASGGDIQIDANGHLNMAQASAQGALNINAASVEMTGKAYAASANVRTPGELVNQQSLAARGRVEINAAKVTNAGTIASGIEADNSRNASGDVTINAPVVVNTGSIEASRALTINAAQTLNNQSVVQGGAVNLTSGQIINQGLAARLVGEQSLFISTPAIVNLSGVIRFATGQAASLQLDSLDNREGLIQATGGSLAISAGALDNSAGQIDAGSLTVASTTLNNRSGLLSARAGDARVTARNTLDNTGGTVQAQNLLSVTGGNVLNQSGSLLGTSINVTAPGAQIDNRSGLIQASGGSLTISADALDNSAGQIDGNSLTVASTSLNNRSGLLSARAGDARVTATGILDNTGGTVQAQNLLSITGGNVLNQTGRLLAVTGNLDLNATGLDNRSGSVLGAGVNVSAPGAQIDNRGGKIVGDRIDLNAAGLDNREQGLLAAGTQGMALSFAPTASQAQLLNSGGQIQSDGGLLLSGAWLDNSAGTLLGQNVLIDAPRLINDNNGAVVSNGGDVTLKVSNLLSNMTGIIDAGSSLVTISGSSDLNNQGGSIRGKQLSLQATTLRNGQQGQLVAGSGGLTYTGGTLDNNGGTLLTSGGTTRLALGSGTVSNVGGTIQGDTVNITAASLDTSSDGSKAGMVSSLVDSLTLNVGSVTSNAGKLFAKTSLVSTGTTLSNTNGAQLSGDSVNLTATNLINRSGLIESNTTLNLQGGSLDNTSGQLRALGNVVNNNAGINNTGTGALRALTSDTSTFDFAGSITNQSGRIEVGNTDFALKANALDNRAGSIEHANTGLLTLDFKRVSGAGGSITALGSGDWNFGAVDGLGNVQLNNALTYTSDSLALLAGDRLASGTGLTLNLNSLNNGGELLSDGDLTLNLNGDLTNSGRLSAQNLLTIKASNVSQNGGRIGAGKDTRLDLGGTLDNLGYLTARQNLRIDAAQIDNRGTLGAQGAVNLNASNAITNSADSLLFSGGAMALRTGTFSNLYGDVYSGGDLSVANLDGSAAQRFSNLSGTVESEGAISINATAVENAKAEFELGQKIVNGSLDWQCGQHCDGHDSFKRGAITIQQTLLETATKDSPSARLVAGKDLTIQAGNVQNRYSLLAANGNLSITANDLLNQGASERTGQNSISIGTPGRIDTGYWDQMEFVDIPAFKAAVAAGNFDLARFEVLKARSSDSRFEEQSNVTVWTDSPQPKYAATLQAGGTVNLNVARTVQNGSLRANNTPEILTGKLGEDQTGIKVGGIDITINKQATDASTATVASVKPVQRVAADGSVQTVFTPVDYSGIPFASVDPTAGATFQLPKGDYGLFIRNPDPTSSYLIETNPNLTNLSKFLGSDYILSRLNISPDNNWRRLGDGLYEQRLIRDAVLAQTGQRFLADGLTSDYDQYRYLMDNALASKSALNLSLGVALNAEQVSALTHDIVWMENRIVDGQKVLVPVLYLAQADSRNLRGNSLIQGRDLNLISGGDLINVGTLRASNNLNVSSGGSIYQGGLVDAGNNLQMIAQDSIRNAMAGEIRGGQVSLTAVKGDILNDRTAIQVRDGAGMRTVTDAGSTITARENLALNAGRDITNYGGMSAKGDLSLKAGNDINLLAKTDSSEKHELFDGGHKSVITTDVKNLSSTVTAGGDLGIDAGRDINVLASKAKAGNDLRLAAGQDINVSSAGDVYNIATKTKDGKKRITEANDRTTQLASELTAGNNVSVQAGRNTTLVASKITAGNEAYLYSGNTLSLLAAQDSTHTLYDMKAKGSFGAKKAQRDEVTQTTNVGTEIRTAGNLTLASNGDQLYQVAKLKSGQDLTLQSGGAVTFEGVKDLHDESHTKSKSDMAWFSMKGKGNTDETLRQSELVAQGQTVIQAVNGLKIDVKQVNQQTVSQTIDTMVKADPQLAWIKDAEKRGDVDWRQVKELHDSFKYSHSGMGQGAMLAVIIIVTVLTAGGASALAGGAAGATAGSGSAMAAATTSQALAAGASYTAAGWGNVMATAALTSMASTGAVSVINNKGNLGTALNDTFGSDSLKNATIGALTAGALNYADSTWFQGASPANGNGAKVITGGPVQNPGYSSEWLSWQKAQDAVVRSGTHAVIESGISTAINGGSLKDNLGSALVSQGFDLAAAVGNKNLGDFADYMDLSPGSAEKIFLHAMLGGALSAARGGDFKTGAIAAGAAEGLTGVATDNLGKYLDTRFVTDDQFRVATAQIVGIAAGSLVNGDPNDAAWVAGNVERYNAQLHKPQTTALEKLRTLNPELSDRLNDAACALSQCAASIPVDDPRYGNFKERQDRGEGYKTEIAMLQATGEFGGRSWTDRSDDFLNAHGNVVQAADASVDTASGIVGGVGSYAGMMATSPVCVGVLTCALPAGLGVLGTQQLVGAWDSASQINAGFISDQPGRVEAAFNLDTFPGESSITKDLAASAGQSVLEMSVFGLAGKYFNSLSAADTVVFPRGGESVRGATGEIVDTLDPVQAARQRQAAMLEENKGFNMSPIGWDKYPTIGRNGTYITDGEAISSITGPLNIGGETVITRLQAAQLEQAMGLEQGSMASGFKVRQVDGITEMSPNSPLQGNEYFQGAGQHLPGGAPEMVIDSIPTIDSAKVKTITTVIVK